LGFSGHQGHMAASLIGGIIAIALSVWLLFSIMPRTTGTMVPR